MLANDILRISLQSNLGVIFEVLGVQMMLRCPAGEDYASRWFLKNM